MTPSLPPVWRKAALLGSVWAAIEIVLGSFLHNIQFPFTGTILAAIGVSLLVAGARIWPERGLLWRTGVVCAAMKSISPSAVIVGPMVGIMLEAFAVEAAVRLAGRNALGFMIGGAVATVMPILQKILGILFTYGLDVAHLYVALYEFAAHSMKIISFGPVDLLVALAGINMLVGLCAVALGHRLAATSLPIPGETTVPITSPSAYDFSAVDPGQRFSVWLLPTHGLAMAGGFAAISELPLLVSAPFVFVYAVLCFGRYRGIARRFKRPRLWIEFAVVSLLAGLLLGGLNDPGHSFTWSGLRIGIQMILRAVLVIAAFSSISVEFRNPLVIRWFLRRGMGDLSSALGVAFQTLPGLLHALGEERRVLRSPFRTLSRVLASAVQWLQQTEATPSGSPMCYIISGGQGTGKTTFLHALITQLRLRDEVIGGILAPAVFAAGRRIGYDLINIRTGERTILCRIDLPPTGIATGPYHFTEQGIRSGSTALSREAVQGCSIIIVDEIGPLEHDGSGWHDSVRELRSWFPGTLILSVRSTLANKIIHAWDLQPAAMWHVPGADPDEACRQLSRSPA